MPTFVTEGKTSFKTIVVDEQDNIVADSGSDTLTLAAGSNITLTTNATTDTVTIASSGEGGGGGAASQIVVTDESTDTSCNVLFTISATGEDLQPKSSTNLTFNSSSGALAASSFVGDVTGNVTGNVSGSSGSCTGNSVTATTATNVTVTDESSDETCNVLFTTGAGGESGSSLGLKTGTGFIFNSTTHSLLLDGDITAFASSDKRLKTNIQPIQDPLTKLQKIGGYTFDWVPKQGIHSHTGNDIGVIAQEIEEVLPEITTTRDNGYKAVKYEKLTAYLIECVKAQQTHIQQLEERIVKLEKKD